MFKSPQQDQTIIRLKQLLSDRYGKELELRRLADASLLETEGGILVADRDLHIPLRIENAYLGTAVIPKGADLPEENRLQIAQVVRMVLEPSLYRDYLERTETNLRLNQEQARDTGPSPLMRLLSGEAGSEQPASSLGLPRLVSNLIHLHGHDTHRIKKAALLLHEMTGRWAFAPFSDLSAELQNTDDLRKLGAMSLFIDDIEALPEAFQKLLMDYVSGPRSAEDPLVITGSLRGASELLESSKLSAEIKDEILVNTLELDRAPLSERGLREVLALMFFEAKGEA